MQKYLSIFLTLNAQPMLISATQVTGVVMATVGTIQIRYHDGGTATLTLSDNMAANDITASNFIADQIVAALETSWTKVVKIVTTQADQALQGIGDAAGAAVTVTSVVLA
jgi:ribosomal protein S4E